MGNFVTAPILISQKTNDQLVSIDRSKEGSIEFYDQLHNSWHLSPLSLELPKEQKYYQLERLGNDGIMLYAFGGEDEIGKVTNKVWCRDLSQPSSQWTAMTPMNQKRSDFSSVVLNGNIYALGGGCKGDLGSCERYESQLNVWWTVAPMNIARNKFSAAVYDGCIYIAGGKNKEGQVERSVEKYDPQSKKWSKISSMITARYCFAFTPFAGRLWAIGGSDENRYALSSVESYDPESDTWREEAPLNEDRSDHATIEFNEELYVVGGSWSEYNKKYEASGLL